MLKRDKRLVRRADFLRVQGSGKRLKAGCMTFIYADGAGRIGFTITRKVGNAVTRNRIRRRLKSLRDDHLSCFSDQLDFVVLVHPRAAQTSFSELSARFARAAARLPMPTETPQ